MGWVWSDELAETLRDSPEFASLVPPSWIAKPSAFAVFGDEDLGSTVKRLLGLADRPDTAETVAPARSLVVCDCGGSRSTADT